MTSKRERVGDRLPRMVDMDEPMLKRLFGELGAMIEDALPPADNAKGVTLYALIAFDGHGVGQYVSNAQRADIVRAMREFADAIESMGDIPR